MPGGDDVELLMLYLQRSVRPEKLLGDATVIHVKFTDIKDMAKRWLVATPHMVDVCLNDRGKEVDVYVTCTVGTMAEIWIGTRPCRKALRDKRMTAVGAPAMTRTIFA